jgi:membrane fusion protein (multidrug efflux system)
MSSNYLYSLRLTALLAATLALSACAQKDAAPDNNSNGSQQGSDERRGPPAPAVVVAPVRDAEFAAVVEALGTAKANEAVDITAKVSNRIVAIHFNEGQSVRKGDVLVQLDNDEARADLAIAEAALAESRSVVNRSRELAVTQALSEQQMEQLETTLRSNEARVAATRARLNELVIRAPFSGRVGLRNASVGGLVGPNTVITTLDDTSVIKLDFSVPETFLANIKAGMEIAATSAAYAGESFRGRVLSVDSRVDPVSRSVVVRALVPNSQGKLKPGMFMTVRLSQGGGKTLMFPEQALVPERDQQFVFAVREGKAYKIAIVVGRRRPGEVEVLEGLTVGDLVVTEGTQKVRDGMPVRITTSADAEVGR